MFWPANGKLFRQSGLCGKPEDICRNIEIFVRGSIISSIFASIQN
jgi:hypothetical protein